MRGARRIGVLGVGNVLMSDDGIGPPKDVLLVGIVPESCESGCGLTKSVRAAVAPAISASLAELRRLGVEAKARARAAKPSIWWEEKASSEFSEEENEDVSGHSG